MDNPMHVELRHRGGVRGVLPSWRKGWRLSGERAHRVLMLRLFLVGVALAAVIWWAG